jgi:hypothetical protein
MTNTRCNPAWEERLRGCPVKWAECKSALESRRIRRSGPMLLESQRTQAHYEASIDQVA